VNVSWYLNDMLVLTNESVLEAKCTLLAEVVGEYNVTAIASNANGSDMQMWIWAVTERPKECEGTDTSCGCYPNCENCNEKDGCYPYGDGCEERDYYCAGNGAGCNYTASNMHNDSWVDTGNTRWVDVNECEKKEQKEQEYRDYKCSAGSCNYSIINDTKWIDTGIYNSTCIDVSLAPLEITSFAPLSYVDDTVGNWSAFNVTLSQTANVSWYLNDMLVLTNESVLEAKCTLHADVVGVHNVTAIASNANGSDMQTWTWDVTELELPKESEGTDTCCGSYPNCVNCTEKDGCYPYGDGCEERDYYCMGDEEGCNYTSSNRHNDGWEDTGNTRCVDVNKCKQKEQKEQEYRDYECSAGSCNYSINDTKWIDTGIYNTTCNGVSLAPPEITSFTPLSYVDDTVGNWRIFDVTVNQAANVSWYLNNTLVLTNESVLEAKCTLHVDVVGEHNVTAIASNANGSDMQTWMLNVTERLNCTCGDICVITTGWWRDGGAFHLSDKPIQAAIDNAVSGETICVKDGTYTENVDVDTQLTIRSENGAASTTVNALYSNDHVFEVTADYVSISGFTVEGATGSGEAGIWLDSNVDHSNIYDNKASGNYYGIYLLFRHSSVFFNNQHDT
jgi:parallel beta-helix repeat protein